MRNAVTSVESTQPSAVAANSIEAFGALCRRLDPGWRTIRNRCLEAKGEKYCIHVILIHQDYGIGLIVFSTEENASETALRVTRNMLRDRGFERSFGHPVPLVFVALDPENCQNAPAQIGRAFSAAPAMVIADPKWVDWVTDTLDRVPSFEDNDALTGNVPGAVQSARRRSGLSAAIFGLFSILTVAGLLLCGAFAYNYVSGPRDALTTASLMSWARELGDYFAVGPFAHPAGRLMTEEQAAAYLGLQVDAFRARRNVLRDHGFPQPEAVTGNYDKSAIDRWLDRQSRSRKAPSP